MVDCEKCIHYEGDSCCEECKNYVRELYDHYEEATAEEIAQRKKESRLRAEREAIDEWMPVEVSDEFHEVFNLVKSFTAEEHFNKVFLGVCISPNSLIASDTHQVVEVFCDFIPEKLINMCVVRLEKTQAGIHTKGKCPPYQKIFAARDEYRKASLKKVKFYPPVLTDDEARFYQNSKIVPEIMAHAGFVTMFNTKYLDAMKDVLEGNIFAHYTPGNTLAPVMFVGNNARMVIAPLIRRTN